MYTMFLAEISEEGGWGRWELKTLQIQLEGVNYPNVASLFNWDFFNIPQFKHGDYQANTYWAPYVSISRR